MINRFRGPYCTLQTEFFPLRFVKEIARPRLQLDTKGSCNFENFQNITFPISTRRSCEFLFIVCNEFQDLSSKGLYFSKSKATESFRIQTLRQKSPSSQVIESRGCACAPEKYTFSNSDGKAIKLNEKTHNFLHSPNGPECKYNRTKFNSGH